MKKILCFFGLHDPEIVFSEYVSFHWRRVTYKCKRCGHVEFRKTLAEDVLPFETAFPWQENPYKKQK